MTEAPRSDSTPTARRCSQPEPRSTRRSSYWAITRTTPAGPISVPGTTTCNNCLIKPRGLTAVFAGSDLLAAGALQALYERGIHVPSQMSVIGFDDTFAKHLAPPLTTVRQPTFEMGLQAGLLAIDLVADRTLPSTVWCKTSLVVRGSTAAPRG